MAKPTAIRRIRRSLCDIPREHAPDRLEVEVAGTWVAPSADMQSSFPQQDAPGLEGPDYVALIIEWNEEDDAATLVGSELDPEPTRRTSTGRRIAAVIGALGALALAIWGIRRLRAA